jgi:O-acetyl-ADP-ribose deacetylase
MSTILREKTFPNGTKFQLAQGDITLEALDAIVNAANSELQHGGGVAWAISRRGGRKIQQESDEWVQKHGPVSHAEPAYTSGGELPCKYVIHAVGPIWDDDQSSGDEADAKLAAAVSGSLRRAEELKLASIVFPAISTGIYGFPKARAASVIFGAVESYFMGNAQSSVKLVRLTLFDQPTIEAFLSRWSQ